MFERLRPGSGIMLASSLLLAGCGHASVTGVAKSHVTARATGLVTAQAEPGYRGTGSVSLKLRFDTKGYTLLAADAGAVDSIVIELRQGPDAPVAARITVSRADAKDGEVTVVIQGLKAGAYNALIQDRNAMGMVLRAITWAAAVEEGQDSPLQAPQAPVPMGPALGPDEQLAGPEPLPAPVDPKAPAAPDQGQRPAGLAPVDEAAPGNGTTRRVPAGSDLQAALDAAQPGDTLVLDAGATYAGAFTLPVKDGASYITLTSSAASQLPGPGRRVSPANAALMPKIVSTGKGAPAIAAGPGAHHYRFVGLEFTQQSPDAVVYDLVRLGTAGRDQQTLAQVPHHFSFDHCYLHALPTGALKRGIALNCANAEVTNCYLSDFKAQGQDSQAIAGWNGPGPFKIVNNHLEAAGENVLFGGADPSIPQLVPSDIEFRQNEVTKQMAWRGGPWSVKNLFELKNARRVLVDGNHFANCWANAQVGIAILFTPRNQEGHAPWSTVEQVTFTHNEVAHAAGGVNILGMDNLAPSAVATGIRVADNLFSDISKSFGGSGNFLTIGEGAHDVVFDHNTCLQSDSIFNAYGKPTVGFQFTNNITPANQYGMHGDAAGSGNDTLAKFFPGANVTNNVIPGAPAKSYPGSNFYPASLDDVGFTGNGTYRLGAGSAYRGKASDGKDVGCDFDALSAAEGDLNNVVVD